MKRFWLAGLLIFSLAMSQVGVVLAQDTETPTPTETPTETPTPEPSATLTETPDFYGPVSTLPSGQAGTVVYTVTVGEAAIAGELVFVIVLLIVILFFVLRQR
jgi:hypothetical protein